MPDLPAEMLAGVEPVGPDGTFRAGVREGRFGHSSMSSLERFPYYTAFPFAWYAACRSDELADGQVRPLRLLARDLVLWRSDDGSAQVMDAHCPHRGANLAVGGEVCGQALICPYHRWEWDAEGRNVGIPYKDGTVEALRVRSYPTTETGGFVFFWFHPDPSQPPRWELPDLSAFETDAWSEPLPFACSYHCPWQEVAENFPDNVHLKVLHGLDGLPEVVGLEFDDWTHRLETRVEIPTPTGPRHTTMHTVAHGPGLSVMTATGVIDSLFLLATTPIDWETTSSLMTYRIRRFGDGPRAEALLADVGAQMLDELATQWSEDIAVFDNKIHVAELGNAPEDRTARRYREWAGRFYVPGDPVAALRERQQ